MCVNTKADRIFQWRDALQFPQLSVASRWGRYLRECGTGECPAQDEVGPFFVHFMSFSDSLN